MIQSTENDTEWTIRRLLDWTTAWFNQHGVEGGRMSAELLLARALGCRKIDLYTRYDMVPSCDQRSAFRELVRQAGEHRPIAYLLGNREFFSLDFEVSAAVLVPRPETEALVQRAIDLCRSVPERTWNILDVGTGSGCVGIAIAHYAANARLVASDISPQALEVAGRNVARHGLTERVLLVQADCVSLPPGVVPPGGFDVIVSNPPYISESAWPTLPPNVRDHEPRIALSIEGSDGLVMYRRFARQAPAVLKPAGLLLAEIGHDQLQSVLDIFGDAGCWNHVATHRDRADPYPRVVEFALVGTHRRPDDGQSPR